MSPARLWTKPWLRLPIVILGIACVFAAIWFGFAMTGLPILSSPWLRGGVIGAILLVLAVVYGRRYAKRRQAAESLEESLVETPVGDGAVLSDRMKEALARLKKSGGTTYLYDLPWYVIIGPPGAGKTTALVHSGLEYPGTDKAAVAGFGGTKNCDFWFAEDAVLIDTAGRYTTQDSDARADRMSWAAFLEQLKRARPDQPINGVLLAFSCEDMMVATDDQLDSHALTVRNRLVELHETLKIDVPVYVMFTKVDMLAGFREYFNGFNQERRRGVWGVTFDTRDRSEETYRAVPAEFDRLISRLSDEVTDRLNEEPDSVTRISIFGFPGQMSLMRRNVADFLRRVFQKPQETHAILRGFYFTSGTQEGTPIDQVLGALSAQGEGGAAPDFMSGKGRSFFLHDLLTKVVFAERDWVGYDFKAMRRRAILRSLTVGAIALACLGTVGLFGYSFWQNATMVREASARTEGYTLTAQALLAEDIIEDPATRPLLLALAELRSLPAGYGDTSEQGFVERVGLSRKATLRSAALRAYSDGLEQLLRPRMMLHLETRLPELVADAAFEEAYRALKVYILLAKEQTGPSDDVAVQSYFADLWAAEYSEPGLEDDYLDINGHLAAMLELDDRVDPKVGANSELVRNVQQAIAVLPLANQAFSSIEASARTLRAFHIFEEMGDVQSQVVFRPAADAPLPAASLDQITVPGLYTYLGYWGTFREALEQAQERLEQEAWVLGEAGRAANYDAQLSRLNGDLHRLYQMRFVEVWNTVFDQIELVPMASTTGQYTALAVAGSRVASPILKLVEVVDRETRLSRFLDMIEQAELDPAAIASGDAGNMLADAGFSEAERGSDRFTGLALRMMRDRAKFQERVPTAGAGAAPSQRRQIEDIERQFEKWHKMLARANEGADRPVDILIAGFGALHTNRANASNPPSAIDQRGLQEALGALTQFAPFYPRLIVEMVNQVEREFLTISENVTFNELSAILTEEIAAYCTQNIADFYPFNPGASRQIPTNSFGEFFGHGGRLDVFYDTHLRAHTQRAPDGSIVPREGSTIGARLNPAMLAEFTRAERIRNSFFPPGGARPQVDFSIIQIGASDGVRRTRISFGDRQFDLTTNSAGMSLTWPDDTADISVALTTLLDRRPIPLRFTGGRWALTNFLTQGTNQVSGTRVTVTHAVDGRSVTFAVTFDSAEVPFLMRELREFNCPTRLE